MSDYHNDPYEWADTYLKAACQDVGRLFSGGAESVPSVVGGYMVTASIIHLAGCIESKLEDIRESLSSIASPPADGLRPSPSPYEAVIMIEALKSSWLKMNPTHTEAQYIAVMRRFEQMAGL